MAAIDHFVLVVPVDWQEEKRVTILEGVIDFDNHEEVGLLLCNGSREEYIWHTCELLGYLLVIRTSVFTVNWQIELNCGQTTAG